MEAEVRAKGEEARRRAMARCESRVEWGCDGRECDVRVVSLNGLGKNEGQDGGARAIEHSLSTICSTYDSEYFL